MHLNTEEKIHTFFSSGPWAERYRTYSKSRALSHSLMMSCCTYTFEIPDIALHWLYSQPIFLKWGVIEPNHKNNSFFFSATYKEATECSPAGGRNAPSPAVRWCSSGPWLIRAPPLAKFGTQHVTSPFISWSMSISVGMQCCINRYECTLSIWWF